jgi:hypothetical protein
MPVFRYRYALSAALAAALALAGIEVVWRLDAVFQEVPGGWWVAEERTLPEGSILPYGTAVYIRPRYVPFHRPFSRLVALGHCGSVDLTWESAGRLRVTCVNSEGEPMATYPNVYGIQTTTASVSGAGI